jgi:hypothetical protein
LLNDISWAEYEHFLEDFEQRPGWRLAYNGGKLEILPPTIDYERYSVTFNDFVRDYCMFFDIEMESGGSTTFHSKLLGKGVEPDECFYIQSVKTIAGKKDLSKSYPIMKTKERFKIEQDIQGRDVFFIESARIEESIKYLRDKGLKNIIINSFYGYHADNLNFLSKLENFIEGLTIVDGHYNLKIINNLHCLRILGLADNGKDIIDLSNFPDLEECAVEYSPRLEGLQTCKNLLELNLTNYNSSNKDFSDYHHLEKLKKLMLIQPKITSLEGIGTLTNLRTLDFFRATKLETIYSIKELKDTLEEVQFESCRKITDFESLAELKNLKKLVISKSGEIKSLSFLKSLKKLEFISFWGTNVLDGDLSYCIGVDYVGFDNKKHYSHKVEQFAKKNSA